MLSSSDIFREQETFLSTLPAKPLDRRLAWLTMALSALVFLVIAPYAKTPLTPVWAFIPIYESALVVCDLVTAALLFGQFGSFRAKGVYILASGYLFTACTAIAHALTFPGLFSATGLLGAGPQTTAWLYFIWHAGFPLFVIAYALSGAKGGQQMPATSSAAARPDFPLHRTVLAGVMTVLLLVIALTLLVTVGHDLLPPVMAGNHYTPTMIVAISTTWLFSLAAFLVLYWRRSPSVLDLWLRVVMCVWLCDIALSAMLNGGRFDLGFYAGRVYGLLAASFVLLILLAESGMLYARLLELAIALRRLTAIDPLTGIANRRAFDVALETDWRRATRSGKPFSLLMIDVDQFKNFNDHYGHQAGDACLRTVAETLAGTVRRAGDLVARYGGEEFAVLLPETNGEEARQLAERMCVAVRQRQVPHAKSTAAAHVTISVGISTSHAYTSAANLGNENTSPEQATSVLLAAADKALYAAKLAGRNQVLAAA